jgi:hypothetical protein
MTGGLSMEERIQLRLIDILDHHYPPELPQDILESIHAILGEEEARVDNHTL